MCDLEAHIGPPARERSDSLLSPDRAPASPAVGEAGTRHPPSIVSDQSLGTA